MELVVLAGIVALLVVLGSWWYFGRTPRASSKRVYRRRRSAMPRGKPVAKPVQQQEAPRQYRRDEIQRFLKEDRLDRRTAARVRRLLGRKRPA